MEEPADPREAVEELTAVAQDYLKVIWTATEWGGAPISTTALAARLGTSAPNVSDTLRRLAGQGLLEYQPYRPVRLTGAGEALALAMVRRHRLLETFLAQVLGYQWHEVHDEAERLEHAVSPGFVDRIDEFLGRPERDPHGDPIPSADGTMAVALGRPLTTMPPGSYQVVRVSDADPVVLAGLDRLGVSPGSVIDYAGGEEPEWKDLAEAVWVAATP